MARQWLRVVIALVILGGLIWIASWHEKTKFETEKEKETSRRLVSLHPDGIRAIAVENTKGLVVIERRENAAKAGEEPLYTDQWAPLADEFRNLSAWRIVEPVIDLPDEFTVSGFVKDLESLYYEKEVDATGERAAEYELKDPSLRIALFKGSVDSEPDLELFFGGDNPSKSGLYVRSSEKDAIYLTEQSSFRDLRDRGADRWRKKEILGVEDMGSVRRLSLTRHGAAKSQSFVAVQREGRWHIESPVNLPADRAGVEEILREIKLLRAGGFVSEDAQKDATRFGLKRPEAEIAVTVERRDTGQEETRSLLIGSASADDGSMFVWRRGYPTVYTVPDRTREKIVKGYAQVVDMKPLDMRGPEVEEIVLSAKGRRVQVRRSDDDKWVLQHPVADRADGSQVSDLLYELRMIKAEEYLPSKPGTRASLLRAELRGDAETRTLELFEGSDEAHLFGLAENPTRYYRFQRSDADKILSLHENLRDHRLSAVDMDSLREVSVRIGSRELSVERKEGSAWTIGKTSGLEAPVLADLRAGSRVEDFVDAAANLRIESFEDGRDIGVSTEAEGSISLRGSGNEADNWFLGEVDGQSRRVWSEERKISARLAQDKVQAVAAFLKRREDSKVEPQEAQASKEWSDE